MSVAEIFDHECPNLLIFDEVDSTSSELKRLISGGYAEAGMVVVADKQKLGYGKEKRYWVSESGNLYFSFLLESNLPLQDLVKINFLLALSIREYLLESFSDNIDPEDLQVKWPNDLLYKDKKFCGILSESVVSDSGSNYIICGIGINLQSAPQNIIESTALGYHGVEVADNLSFILDFLYKFEVIFVNWLNSDKQDLLISELNNNLAYKGKEIFLSYDAKEYCGIVQKVDVSGCLHFVTKEGEMLRVSSGDLYKFRIEDEEVKNVFHINNKEEK